MKTEDEKRAQNNDEQNTQDGQMAQNLDTGKMEKIKKPDEDENIGDFFSGSDGGSAGDGGGA